MTHHAAMPRRAIRPHLVAGLLALAYAFAISRTRHVASAAQFVGPALVILAVHVASLAAGHDRQPGFSLVALQRTFATSLALVVGAALLAAFAPMPVEAAGDPINSLLGVLACIFVLVVVVAVVAGAVYLCGYLLHRALRGLWWLLMRASGSKSPPGGTGLLDAGVLVLAGLALAGASLEGISPTMTSPADDRVEATLSIAAPPVAVWAAIGKASSPDLPLPLLLQTLPRAVKVTDGGDAIGSRRIVHFRGREGSGDLVLEVIARTEQEMTWKAVADTTPMRGWVVPRQVDYRVEPAAGGSVLRVSMVYGRRLAPAWFFRPYMRAAARAVVDVLAHDKKARAEAWSAGRAAIDPAGLASAAE